MKSMKVVIALATCNGETYLAELLESLRRQSWTEWTLLIKDDASDDRTPDLLARWAATERRITLLKRTKTKLGAAQNFGCLMQVAKNQNADYVFFADQDDVWLPDKMSRQLQRMREEEAVFSPMRPVLVHTDLVVADEQLGTIHPSFKRYCRLDSGNENALENLLVRNCATGCTTLINAPLLQLASPLPLQVVMHDWWMALCAAAAGSIAYLPQPSVIYRQHAHNLIGARRFWGTVFRILGQRGRSADRLNFLQSIAQVESLRRRIVERFNECPPESVELLERYCALFRTPMSRWARIHELMRMGVPNSHPLARLGAYGRVLMVT